MSNSLQPHGQQASLSITSSRNFTTSLSFTNSRISQNPKRDSPLPHPSFVQHLHVHTHTHTHTLITHTTSHLTSTVALKHIYSHIPHTHACHTLLNSCSDTYPHTHTLTGIAYLRHMLTPRHITEVGGASNEVFDLLYVM